MHGAAYLGAVASTNKGFDTIRLQAETFSYCYSLKFESWFFLHLFKCNIVPETDFAF